MKHKKGLRRLISLMLVAVMSFGLLPLSAFVQAAEGDTATHTVTFYDWDGSQIGEAQQVEDGKAATAPEHPGRDGWVADGWDKDFSNVTSDLDVTAQYKKLESRTITINYFYENSTRVAAQPYVASVIAGESFSDRVISPDVVGFSPDQSIVDISIDSVTEDKVYTVYYLANGSTAYKVQYLQQKVDGSGYDVVDELPLSATTGTVVTAPDREYAGFTRKGDLPSAEVAADGGTVLQVYYDRNTYAIYYHTNGGNYIDPTVALYGADVSQPSDPTRAGYDFAGWYVDETLENAYKHPSTMPATDQSVYAKWEPKSSTKYTVVYWLENATNDGYDYGGIKTMYARPGTTVSGSDTNPTQGYVFNSAKTDKNVVVNGDGSTVVNVYYDRGTYTITFKVFNDGYFDDEDDPRDYTTKSEWTITAKYGQEILDQWPTPEETIKWHREAGSSSYLLNLKYMENHNIVLYGTVTSGSYKYTAYHCVESLTQRSGGGRIYKNGIYYDIYATVSYKTNSSGITIDKNSTYTIPGFKNTGWDNYEKDGNKYNRVGYIYYSRDVYTLSFYNNNQVEKSYSKVKYEANIEKYNYVPTTNPFGSDYTFGGWYTTKELYPESKFNWNDATMPAGDLQLYAKWDPPVYTVKFDLNGGSGSINSQEITKGGLVSEPQEPTREGYTFEGWYKTGENAHYLFEREVHSDFTLKAKWSPRTDITYTVKYVDENGEKLADPKTVTGQTMGSTVTETAKVIDSYLPEALTKSTTLKAKGNEIVFTYKKFTEVDYTVYYIIKNAGGSEKEHSKKTMTSKNAVVTENYKNIAGYTPDAYQKTLQLVQDESKNVIKFYYTQNAQVSYTVNHYVQKLGGGYELKESDTTKTGSIGAKVTASAKDYTGFTYQSAISTDTGIIPSTGTLTLNLYYTRNNYGYTVKYLEQGTNKKLADPYTAKAAYGDDLTVNAKGIAGYSVVGESSQQLTISENPKNNVVIFYYTLRTDLSYTVNYLEKGTDPANVLREPSVVGGQTHGDTVTVTAPATIQKNGKVYNLDGADSVQIEIKETGNVVNFYYTEAAYNVTYDANGGSGEVKDDKTYKQGHEVTVKSGDALSYTDHVFLGWTTTAYEPFTQAPSADIVFYPAGTKVPMTSGGITFYAAWAIDQNGPDKGPDEIPDYEEYSVTYKDGFGDGSITDEAIYPANYTYTVAGKLFDRTNYDFLGWKDHNNTLVNANYKDYKILGDTTFTARWTPTAFTITYKGMDGATLGEGNENPVTYTVETDTFTLFNPEKAGYKFLGWSGTGIDDKSDQVVVEQGSSGNREYTANWERIDYSISYDLDGGSLAADKQNPTSYNVETETFTLFNPEKAGYKFLGWSGTGIDDKSDQVVVEQGSSGNREYTANWERIDYSISYDLDGGSLAADKQNPTSYNVETETFTLFNPEKAGYTFTGWTGTGLSGATLVVTIEQGSTGDREYTANFTKDSYTIQYAGLENAVVEENPASYSVDTETFTLNNPTKDGYTFLGWSGTDVDGMSKEVTVQKGSTGNRAYTANWQPEIYNIQYRGLDGATVAENRTTYTIETDTFTLHNPTKSGYNFLGWEGTGFSGTAQTVTVTKGSTGDRVYTAKWEAIDYRIDYELAGGSLAQDESNPTKYTIETETFTLHNPTRTGYTFTGWTGTDLEGETETVTVEKGSTGDRIYTANWEKIGYDIEYDLAQGVLPEGKENPVHYDVETETFTLNNPTRSGYTFAGWTGTDLTAPTMTVQVVKGSTGDRSYTAHWTENYDDTKALTYYVEYWLEGESTYAAREVKTEQIWVESDSYKVNAVDEKTFAGYTFKDYTVNGSQVATPITVYNGQTIRVNYTINPDDTKKLTYYVEHYIDGEETYRDREKVEVDIWAAADSYSVTAVQLKDYTGYTFRAYNVELPYEVSENGVIKVYYEKDLTAQKELTYYVEHWVKGEETYRDRVPVTEKIWVNDNTFKVTAIAQNIYTGYKFDSYSVELPYQAKNGDVIRVNYVRDDDQQKEITYTVEHWVEGETAARDTEQVTVRVWVGDDTAEVTSIAQNTYDGYQFSSYSVELPYQVKDGDVIRVNYAAEPAPVVPPVTPVTPTTPPTDATPAGPVTPVTPAAPDTPAAPETPVVEEPATPEVDTPEVEIQDPETPLAQSQSSWALLNLLLAIATALVSVLLIVGYILGRNHKKDEDENSQYARQDDEDADILKRKGIWRLLSLVPGIGSIIVFFLTEDMRNPMIFTDKWTLLMLIIAVVQLIISILCIKRRKDNDQKDDPEAVNAQ